MYSLKLAGLMCMGLTLCHASKYVFFGDHCTRIKQKLFNLKYIINGEVTDTFTKCKLEFSTTAFSDCQCETPDLIIMSEKGETIQWFKGAKFTGFETNRREDGAFNFSITVSEEDHVLQIEMKNKKDTVLLKAAMMDLWKSGESIEESNVEFDDDLTMPETTPVLKKEVENKIPETVFCCMKKGGKGGKKERYFRFVETNGKFDLYYDGSEKKMKKERLSIQDYRKMAGFIHLHSSDFTFCLKPRKDKKGHELHITGRKTSGKCGMQTKVFILSAKKGKESDFSDLCKCLMGVKNCITSGKSLAERLDASQR